MHMIFSMSYKGWKISICYSRRKIDQNKKYRRVPYILGSTNFKKFNLRKKDIDYIAIATKRIVHTNLFNVPVSFSVSDYLKMHEKYYYPTLYEKKKISEVFKDFKFTTNNFYPMKKYLL